MTGTSWCRALCGTGYSERDVLSRSARIVSHSVDAGVKTHGRMCGGLHVTSRTVPSVEQRLGRRGGLGRAAGWAGFVRRWPRGNDDMHGLLVVFVVASELFQTGADRVGRRGRECGKVWAMGSRARDCWDVLVGFGIATAMRLTLCAKHP